MLHLHTLKLEQLHCFLSLHRGVEVHPNTTQNSLENEKKMKRKVLFSCPPASR